MADEKVEYANPTIEVHAKNVQNPSHMEWTDKGRLIVSSHSSGSVFDVTDGGDMSDATPFAEGLGGPASILPLDADRLLISESQNGQVMNIAGGGKYSDKDPFASGLSRPYSLGRTVDQDGNLRVVATEKRPTIGGSLEAFVTDITGGGEDHDTLVSGIPTHASPTGPKPDGADWDWDKPREAGFTPDCNSWASFDVDTDRLFLSISPLGEIMEISDAEGTTYQDLIHDKGRVIARGLNHTGGLKYNSHDGLLYGVEPYVGSIFAVDPEDSSLEAQRVVSGLDKPGCLRFGPENEMYVCGRGQNVIFEITDYK
ncbi:hypothetical protein KVP04_01265 [Halobacterium salinarum]|uniref:hypothetical protein n=1 Tax=Halobacterium salinarum TaxID=2242 RepID=UPI001F18CD10|nr:hypothetical protein [Halobacterium salinarum]MCF2237760.1 hypothetical protein [Halobacterium salinarum]